jgi:hypothetical protein
MHAAILRKMASFRAVIDKYGRQPGVDFSLLCQDLARCHDVDDDTLIVALDHIFPPPQPPHVMNWLAQGWRDAAFAGRFEFARAIRELYDVARSPNADVMWYHVFRAAFVTDNVRMLHFACEELGDRDPLTVCPKFVEAMLHTRALRYTPDSGLQCPLYAEFRGWCKLPK